MMKSFSLKQGSTLRISGVVTLPTGLWSATSFVRRWNGTMLDELTVTMESIVDAESLDNKYNVTLVAGNEMTEVWPIEQLQCDIRFSNLNNDDVMHSPTFVISVEGAVTDA